MVSDDIRALLRADVHAETGLHAAAIARLLGISSHIGREKVNRALRGRHMPDAYIDRWVGSTPIWKCAYVPENCPRPRRDS